MELNVENEPISDLRAMDRCPIEIFTEIFQCVIRLSDPPDPYHKPSTEWLRLLLVSRAWRDTILKTKSLWSTIQVHGENGERWLKLSLGRARGAAISISIDFENIPHLDLTPLLEHASDIRSVRLDYLPRGRLPDLNTFLSSGLFSSLKSIRLWVDRGTYADQEPGEAPHLLLSKANVPFLEALRVDIKYIADPRFFEYMETLTLLLSWRIDFLPEFMSALCTMKRLRSLDLSCFSSNAFPHSPVTLPSLTQLKISPGSISSLTRFLSYLHLPRATDVRLHYITDGRVDAQGREELTGSPAGIGDILPRRRTDVLPFLPLLTDLALTIRSHKCEFAASSPGKTHAVEIGYDTETPGMRAIYGVTVDPLFQLRDLTDVASDCPATTSLTIHAECVVLTADHWRALLGALPLLVELRVEARGSLAPLWAVLDPGGSVRDAVPCPALRTLSLRDYNGGWNPWHWAAGYYHNDPPPPRLDICVDALGATLRARAGRGAPVAKLSYVAAPRMEELDEFRTVWRGAHAAALAEHATDVSIKTMYEEVEGKDAGIPWREVYEEISVDV